MSERSPPLAIEGQQPHQLSLCTLLPRVDFHLAPREPEPLFVVTALLLIHSQAMQGLQHLPLELLPLDQRPVLKGHAIGQAEPLKECSSIQRHRLLHRLNPLRVLRQAV